MNRGICLTAAALLLLTCGCSTIINSHRQKEEMMAAYLAGEENTVTAALDGKLNGAVNTGDEIMWRLEAGAWKFLRGDDAGSFAQFTRAEELMADYDQRAVVNMRQAAAEGTMLLTNPNTLPYRGLCRDRVLFPVYKALACLGQKNEAGFRVELFHLRETQDRVISDYRKYFQEEQQALQKEQLRNPGLNGAGTGEVLGRGDNAETAKIIQNSNEIANRGYGNFLNPFTIFMSGYGYLRDGDYENALVDFERLYQAMPGNLLVRSYYAAARQLAGRDLPGQLTGTVLPDFPLNRNNVLIIFASGRSAAYIQRSLYIPLYYAGVFSLAAIAWPVCECYPAPFGNLQVQAGSRTLVTQTIADMDGIFTQEYRDRLPGMMTRMMLCTAAKEAAAYAAVRAARHGHSGAGAATSLLVSAYKAAFNTADTRSWELLPKEFQIAQCPVPADRKIILTLPTRQPLTVTLPPDYQSAIIWFNVPSAETAAMSCRVFGFRDK